MLLDSSTAGFEGSLNAELRKRVVQSRLEHDASQRVGAAARALGIVGSSPVLLATLRAIERSARLSDMPVLLIGDSGTGKELLARAVHLLDGRRQQHPFIAINCAALTKTLAESELFGHRKGAFSGADRERPGLVRAADGGVLFLDEIGELDLDLQAKLLRVIQERRVRVLGDTHETPVDVRIVAATHRDLRERVLDGRFRSDLLNRLWVYPITVPPLRERLDDIPELVEFFIAKHAGSARAVSGASRDFIAALRLAELEGNVRQLENIVQRAIVVAEPDRPLGLGDLPAELWAELANHDPGATESVTRPNDLEREALDLNLARAIFRHERSVIEAALQVTGGNQTRAAGLLGITTRSIYNKLRKHQLAGRGEAAD
jgi:transcriptional regulator with PAS, ATPase and Fis domain